MQDKLFKDSKKYSTDHMSPNYTQKEYFIKRRKSSDLTSESICPTDDMSITSENFFIPTEKKQSSYINYSNETEEEDEENELDYFYGVKKYFRKTSPEKFYEYKRTRNYISKKSLIKKEEPKAEKVQSPDRQKEVFIPQSNMTYNYPPQFTNNMICFPVFGNMFYMYNNFFFNINSLQKEESKVIEEEIKKDSTPDTAPKEEEKENKEVKEDDDIEAFKGKKYYGKGNKCFAQRKKYQYYNKNKYHKYSKEGIKEQNYTYNLDETYHYNKSSFENENWRKNQSRYWNKFSEDFNEGTYYKKYDGNYDRRWNKKYYENNFQRKKYYY